MRQLADALVSIFIQLSDLRLLNHKLLLMLAVSASILQTLNTLRTSGAFLCQRYHRACVMFLKVSIVMLDQILSGALHRQNSWHLAVALSVPLRVS